MKRILLIALVLCFVTETANAWPRFRLFRRRTRSTYSAPSQFSGNAQAIAQQKANLLARRGRVFHPGGSFGGGRYEGVGSGSTAQQALNNCCFSGARGSKGPKRNCIAAGVAQSSNGRYYACRLYR